MSFGVAEVEAGDFLDDDGIGVAYTGLLEVEDVAAPTEVCALGEELRVESEGTTSHTVEVEEFVVHGEDFAKIGFPALKFKIPNLYGVLEAELVALNLGEGGEEVASAEKHLAFVADACAHEEILGDIHKVIVGDDGDMLRAVPLPYFDVFSRLPPNALGEPLAHAVLGGMTHTVHVAEEVGVFHGQSHIIDAILLKVVEVPVYLFVGDFVEG